MNKTGNFNIKYLELDSFWFDVLSSHDICIKEYYRDGQLYGSVYKDGHIELEKNKINKSVMFIRINNKTYWKLNNIPCGIDKRLDFLLTNYVSYWDDDNINVMRYPLTFKKE